MLAFYGFNSVPTGESIEIIPLSDFLRASRHWFTRFDHNHLRITRIIRSLRVLGLEQNASAFFKALENVHVQFPGRLSARSVNYWRRAALRPLHLAPDVDDDDSTRGKQFLLDFEAKQAATMESSVLDDEQRICSVAKEQVDERQASTDENGEPLPETSNATLCPVPE
jgi:hypothetical protein